MSGEGFSADAGGPGDGAAGGGEAGSYAGYNGSGDRLPASTRPAGAHSAAREQQSAPGRHDSPPQSWAREHHEHWANVPEPLRPYLHQRESEQHQRISELGQQAKAHGEIAQAFERFGMAKLPQGLTHAKAVESLLAAGQALQKNPGPVLAHLAKVNGVDLAQLAGFGGNAPAMLQKLSGQVAALQQENAALKRQQVEGLEQQKQAEQKRRAEQERQIKEARRQSGINQTSGRAGPAVRGTLRQTLERQANGLMG